MGGRRTLSVLQKLLLLTGLGIVAAAALACDDSPNRPPSRVPTPDDPVTPRADREAEEAALWLSEDLIAPQDLYDRINRDLTDIRATFGDTLKAVDVTFRPWWIPSWIRVHLDDEGIRLLRAGTFSQLDSLNDALGLAELDSARMAVTRFADLQFEGRLHPFRLKDLYGNVPHVTLARINAWTGDYPNVYPWVIDGGMSYLFRDAWGDCPAGCAINPFWYFTSTDAGIELVGHWEDAYLTPEPDWWAEGKVAFEQFLLCEYRGFNQFCQR